MKAIQLPSFLTSKSFWLAVCAGGLTFAAWKSGAVDTNHAVAYAIGTLGALKVAFGLESMASSNASGGGTTPPAQGGAS